MTLLLSLGLGLARAEEGPAANDTDPLDLRVSEPLEPDVAPTPAPAPEVPFAAPGSTPAAPPSEGQRWRERLEREAAGVDRLVSGWSLGGLLVLAAVGVGIYALTVRAARRARDAGYDLERRWVGIRGLVAIGVTAWVGLTIGRYVIDRAPLLGTALTGVFLSAVLVLLARRSVQGISGMFLLASARVREGDRLTVGDLTGVVEHAGAVRLRLRRVDGSIAHLRADHLGSSPLIVSSPQKSQAVAVRIPWGAPPSDADEEAVRRLAALCPYRAPGTAVRIERSESGGSVLAVHLEGWSTEAARAADRWLRQAARDLPNP